MDLYEEEVPPRSGPPHLVLQLPAHEDADGTRDRFRGAYGTHPSANNRRTSTVIDRAS
jgi:hypothetical protein